MSSQLRFATKWTTTMKRVYADLEFHSVVNMKNDTAHRNGTRKIFVAIAHHQTEIFRKEHAK